MIQAIKKELADNPATYDSLSDAEVVPLLRAISIVSAREGISGSELFGYTDETEYNALTVEEKQQWLGLCGIDFVTKDAVPIIKSIFNGASNTWGNVVKTETKYPFANVNEGDITSARAS